MLIPKGATFSLWYVRQRLNGCWCNMMAQICLIALKEQSIPMREHGTEMLSSRPSKKPLRVQKRQRCGVLSQGPAGKPFATWERWPAIAR